MLSGYLMRLALFTLLFLQFTYPAESGIFDIFSDCPASGSPFLKIENGKVTQCGPTGSAYIEQKENRNDGSSYTFIATGQAANNITARKNEQNFETNVLNTVNELKDRVFPVVDQTGKILGTAFRYKDVTLTALHVVISSSPQNPLYIYNSELNKGDLIRGYAPIKRESGEISPYQDICVLDIAEHLQTPSFSPSLSPTTSRFQYLELSYPKGKNSRLEPSAFSSFISLPKTDRDALVILNRNGQDFNSSGGPVIDVQSRQARAMTICIEPGSGSVKALDLYRLNSDIDIAVTNGFLPDLSQIIYDFTYSKTCGPVGGRGGGP